MAEFRTNDLKICDRLRKEQGIVPVEALGGGYLQPKTYVFTQSDEEINALLAVSPVTETVPEEPVKEEQKSGFPFFKKKGKNLKRSVNK